MVFDFYVRMKIDKQKFRKLRTEKRIEYLLRLKRVEEKCEGIGFSCYYIIFFASFATILIYLDSIAEVVVGKSIIGVLFIFLYFVVLTIIVVVIDLVYSIISVYLKNKRINELDKEFFKLIRK